MSRVTLTSNLLSYPSFSIVLLFSYHPLLKISIHCQKTDLIKTYIPSVNDLRENQLLKQCSNKSDTHLEEAGHKTVLRGRTIRKLAKEKQNSNTIGVGITEGVRKIFKA